MGLGSSVGVRTEAIHFYEGISEGGRKTRCTSLPLQGVASSTDFSGTHDQAKEQSLRKVHLVPESQTFLVKGVR